MEYDKEWRAKNDLLGSDVKHNHLFNVEKDYKYSSYPLYFSATIVIQNVFHKLVLVLIGVEILKEPFRHRTESTISALNWILLGEVVFSFFIIGLTASTHCEKSY